MKTNWWRDFDSQRRNSEVKGLIRHRLETEHVNRGTNITPMEQLLVTMRYLATGCFQRITADFVGISISSANRIINRVCNIIALSHKEYIKCPQTEVGIQTTKQNFMHIVSSPASLAL